MNPLVLLNLFRARAVQVAVNPSVMISAAGKLVAKLGFGVRASVKEAEVLLTPLEQSLLLTAGKDIVFKLAGVTFLMCIVGDTVRGLIAGDDAPRPLVERLAIVAAHVLKGSTPLVQAFAAIEQGAFYVAGEIFGDADPHIEIATDPVIDISVSPRREVDPSGPSEVFKSSRRW